MKVLLSGMAAATAFMWQASLTSAATNVVIIGVENLSAESVETLAQGKGHGGFGRLLESGVRVGEGVPLATWSDFFQPAGQMKSFFDIVNDRLVEMKQYHLVIADKFAQDFQSTAYHTWPRMNTLLEKSVSVPCPPYTSRSWSPPCTALQEVQLLHSCVAYDETSFEITGDADCPSNGLSTPAADADGEDDDEDDQCAACQQSADADVVQGIVDSMSSTNPGNIVFGYLQSQQLSSINKSLHTLITAIDNVEDDTESWGSYSLIVTGATHTLAVADAARGAWLAYGAGLRSAEGGAVVDGASVEADVTLATTLKLLGLDASTYSKPPADLFGTSKAGAVAAASHSDATDASSSPSTYSASSARNCQQHNGRQGACPSAFESWFYKEFPEHVALFSFLGGVVVAFTLVCLSCVGYIVGRAVIIGSKKVLGYRTVGSSSAPQAYKYDEEDGGKAYADADDSDSD